MDIDPPTGPERITEMFKGADLALDAVDATAEGDQDRATAAIRGLGELSEPEVYAATAVFAHLALAAVQYEAKPGATWTPIITAGEPPRPVPIDTDPAAAFVSRFLTATLNDDEELRFSIWQAFVTRIIDETRPEAETQHELNDAIALLVRLAAAGRPWVAPQVPTPEGETDGS
jgi:hypothetical protein